MQSKSRYGGKLILSGLMVLFAAGAFVFTRPSPADRFSRALADAVHRNPDVIHLEHFVTPGWEQLYVFGPYTTPDKIAEAMGFQWSDAAMNTIQRSDSSNLLLFVSNQTVVLSALHPRNQGDFSPHAVGRTFTPGNAVFTAVRREKDGWLLLQSVSL